MSLTAVMLHTRTQDQRGWTMQNANHADRNVHTALLGPFSSLDGVVEYHPRVNDLVDPPDALSDAYTSTLLI
jgi:hypothetical protein